MLLFEKISTRFHSYCTKELSIEIEKPYMLTIVDQLNFQKITAFLTLENHHTHMITLSVSEKFGKILLKKFLKNKIHENQLDIDLTNDTLCEILNIVVGNILDQLIDSENKSKISPPFAIIDAPAIHKNDGTALYSIEMIPLLENLTEEKEKIILGYFTH